MLSQTPPVIPRCSRFVAASTSKAPPQRGSHGASLRGVGEGGDITRAFLQLLRREIACDVTQWPPRHRRVRRIMCMYYRPCYEKTPRRGVRSPTRELTHPMWEKRHIRTNWGKSGIEGAMPSGKDRERLGSAVVATSTNMPHMKGRREETGWGRTLPGEKEGIVVGVGSASRRRPARS